MLTTGTRLGSYEILGSLGAGGMGEVYRARDTKLSREVAIKILPDAVAHDAERLARFDREARLLAALHHPHIASIFGLEEVDGRKFLVLEFVDGQSLADRLARGPLPIDEALRLARQLVDALEAAHERGVIHRDLKPANIMLTVDEQVKVLDFGLAKQIESETRPELSQSPTLSFGATQTGVILGTAAYMSPEQAKGRPADKRSDVWAFGCVLYEMLSGKKAFQCEDIADTLAAILRAEPDLSRLPANTPAHVRTIIKRCFEKDRTARIPDIAVVRFLLDDGPRSVGVAAGANATTQPESSRLWKLATAVCVLMTIGMGAAVVYLSRSTPAAVTRFYVHAPARGVFTASAGRLAPIPRISPDGRKLAFTARDASGKTLLWVQSLDSLDARAFPGTDGAAWPFWSPDSRQIGFSTPGKLMKIDANGGPPQTLASLQNPTNVSRGGAWSQDGVVVFSGLRGISRISASGGEISVVAEQPEGQGLFFPEFLPDGRHVLFVSPNEDEIAIHVTSLDTRETKRLFSAGSGAIYAPSRRSLVFLRQGTLFAQPFDVDTLKLSGEPVAVVERVASDIVPGAVTFSLSRNGILAYGTDSNVARGLRLDWVDRQGRTIETIGSLADYRGVDLGPDGKWIVWHDHDRRGGDVWLFRMPQGPVSRLTFDVNQDNSSPIWSADGKSVVFSSLRDGKWGLYRKNANGMGTEERLIEAEGYITAWSVAPDGKLLVYETGASRGPQRTPSLWLLPLAGDATPKPLWQTRFQETRAQISPNGKWIAYSSDETGILETFVRPFPTGSGKWQISRGGGAFGRWRGDSRELFFMNATSAGKMMAVEIASSGEALEHGAPKELFETEFANIGHPGGPFLSFAVSPDGQRFLIPRPPITDEYRDSGLIAVVENWTAGLGQRIE